MCKLADKNSLHRLGASWAGVTHKTLKQRDSNEVAHLYSFGAKESLPPDAPSKFIIASSVFNKRNAIYPIRLDLLTGNTVLILHGFL